MGKCKRCIGGPQCGSHRYKDVTLDVKAFFRISTADWRAVRASAATSKIKPAAWMRWAVREMLGKGPFDGEV